LANIPGTSVDKIEVITNPSAKYDAQGGAIINIKTSKPANLGTNGTYTAGIGMGKYAKYNTGITLNHRSKTTNIYGSYNFDHNAPYNTDSHIQQVNGFPGKISEDERSTDKKNSQSFKLGLDHDFNKNNSAGILFKGNVNYKDMLVFNRSVAYTLSQQQEDSSSTVNTNGNASVFSPSVNVYYRSVLNKKGGELNLNADWFIYSKKWKEDFVTNYFLPDGSFDKAPTYLRDNSPADNNVRSFAADYSQPITKGKLEAGIKTTFTKTDNNVLWENKLNNTWVTDTGKTNRFIYRENINAAYISINKAAGKYNLTGGLRAEQTNTSGDLSTQRTDKTNYINLFPNFSAVYIKDAKNMFIFNYKKSIVRYGFNYVNPFITYQSQYSYSQGNPYL
ncbi:MAG TPA: outer membrane beta-barrel family protein, partial [Panacibacter sp.]|nr:outer membrane beta-barrel family protein [Panacibacter sp.]